MTPSFVLFIDFEAYIIYRKGWIMERRRKEKVNKTAIFVCAALFIISAGLFFLIGQNNNEDAISVFSAAVDYGEITPIVRDAYSGKVIVGAEIVFPEYDLYYTTDEKGSCGKISLPIRSSKKYQEIFMKPFGETDILIYADGYLPTALFGLQFSPENPREIELLIVPETRSDLSGSILLTEAPYREWAEAYIEEFRPSKSSLTNS